MAAGPSSSRLEAARPAVWVWGRSQPWSGPAGLIAPASPTHGLKLSVPEMRAIGVHLAFCPLSIRVAGTECCRGLVG